MQNSKFDVLINDEMARAVELHQAGRLTDAETGYRTILQKRPRHAGANHNLGVLALQLNQPQAALPFLITALEVDSDNGLHWLSLIECLVRLEAWFDADDILSQAEARGFNYPEMVEFRTKIMVARHVAEETETLKVVQELVANPSFQCTGSSHGDSMKKVMTFFQAGDWKNMEASALTAIKSDGAQGCFWHMLGFACLQQEKLQLALFALDKASALLPEEAEVWGHKAVVLNSMGNYVGAEECYQRSLALVPHQADLLNKAGVNALDSGRHADAEHYLKRALELQPDFALAHNNIGNVYQRLGCLELALSHYQKALQINPDFSQALNNLGCVQQELGMPEAAVASYQRALQLKPDYTECLSNLGFALYELDWQDDALACFQKSLSLKSDVAEVLCGLGRVLLKKQRIAEAADFIERGLQLSREHPGCVMARLRLLDARGEFAEMDRYLNQIIDDAVAVGSMPAILVNECLTPALSSASRKDVLPMRLARIAALSDGDVRFNGMLATYAMLAAWMDRDDESLNRLTVELTDFLMLPETGVDKNLHRFARYMQFLCNYRKKYADLYTAAPSGRLNVIGDSHCLSPVGAVFDWLGERLRGCGYLVAGVKMHHLAQAGANRYQREVEEFLKVTPFDEPLLLTVGEIDCRPDSGVWKAWHKRGGSLEEIVANTVDGYLNWLAGRLAKTRHSAVTLQGIPAPGYIQAEEKDFEGCSVFLGMIHAVNLRLQAGAAALGWSFLDVYAATADDSGLGNGRWHLDAYHLQPGFYAQAQNWLVDKNI